MKRIIVFRFHDHATICQNRLRCLKKYNPFVKIYGLFGGLEKDYKRFHRKLMPWLEHCYCIRGKSERWKWKNSDLALQMWFNEFGNTLSFDMLHLIEWDLVMVDALDTIYKKIPLNAIGLTALLPLQSVADQWLWTSEEPYKSECDTLLAWARDTFNYSLKPYGSQGPGLCMPKQFLEACSSIEIPELCNDEVRIPLLGQIFGFDMVDTHFCSDWFTQRNAQTFHCQTQSQPQVSLSTIRRECKKASGKRVFHPFRKIVILNRMDIVRSLFITVNDITRPAVKRILYPFFTRFLKKEKAST